MKPNMRPARPDFSSGPCAKRPGWTPEVLKDAAVGRSHRSKLGKKKIVEAVDRTRALLGIPADYRVGIVPASDTGAVEMALWSLLGRPAGRHADLGKLRRGLGHRCGQAAQAQGRARAQGALRPDRRSQGGRLDARCRLHLERHDLGRESAERRLDRRRPRGARDLRRHLGRVRHGPAVAQARCRDLVLAEGDGRGGRARRAGAVAARRPAAGKLFAAVADAQDSSA